MRGQLTVVAGGMGVGGTETHLLTILPLLRARGWDIDVLCIVPPSPRAELVRQVGIPVAGPHFAPGAGRLGKLVACLSFLIAALAKRRRRPLAFYLPEAYILGMVAALAVVHRGPRVMFRRSLNNYQRKVPLLRRLEPLLHHLVDRVVGNSRAVVDQLVAEEGVAAAKSALIYNGIAEVSVPPRAVARRQLGVDDGVVVVAVVANLIPYKGHEDLLRGLAMFSARLPENWVLMCAGRNDGILDSLERLADQLGIADNIRWLGERSDVPVILAASDFVVLPSHEEGFSNALLEAMMAGRPVVATRVGGNVDTVEPEVTGLLVPARNPQALGAAIVRLATDAPERARMGGAARQRVEANFSLRACVDAYDRLYTDLIGAPSNTNAQ